MSVSEVSPAGDILVDDARPATGEGDQPRRAALSPSRINDFKQCPLLFRLRTVDRLAEPPSSAATRGTLVHAVLERLFDLPAAQRTPEAAHTLVAPQWDRLLAGEPELAGLFADDGALAAWLDSARALLSTYFTLEDPRRLEPAEREMLCEVELSSGVLVRGIVDRLDVARDGALRVVDYKTGRSPSVQYAASALFQMRFYALVLWRLRGVVPRRLQLVYLGDGRVVTYDPDERSLLATERVVDAVWTAIRRATLAADFPARPSRLCDWCAHRALCPSFGGTVPQWPADGGERLLGVGKGGAAAADHAIAVSGTGGAAA
jgi:putative RecB family exonuclease